MNKVGLLRQHDEILGLVDEIIRVIDSNKVEEDINSLVRNINTMSGKLKIHLSSEDKYLYPKLLNSENLKLKDFGKKYYDEMKDVTKSYEDYKYRFNTGTKIKNNIELFKKETKIVFKVLTERIERENKELYPLID